MSIESFQDTLFEDPVGLRFRHAREKSRLSLESVAQQLKLPVAVLDAIEREDWARLGAPIFVRSYLGSYARLLGLPDTIADEVVRGKPAPPLVSIGGPPLAKNAATRGAAMGYLLLVAAIVAAVAGLAWFYQSPRSAAVVPLDEGDLVATMAPPPATVGATAPGEALAVASFEASGESGRTNPAPGNEGLALHFVGDSWVDLVDAGGTHLERGLLVAGSERHFEPGQLRAVTLGDASAVQVTLDGATLDLSPYRDANVARFTVSSDGRIERF